MTSVAVALAEGLIGSGPFWSAIVPLVSSASKGATDAIRAWQRERARKRYEATFGILSGAHADLYEKIKNSFALIEACDEIVRAQNQRPSSFWRWLFVIAVMVLTGFRTSNDSLTGDGLPEVPRADFVDPLIAAVGGFLAPWLGNVFATLTGRGKIGREAAADGEASAGNDGEPARAREVEVDAISYYASVRDVAQKKLIMALSEQIVTQAEVKDELAEIDAKARYARWDPRRYVKKLRRSPEAVASGSTDPLARV